MKILLMQLNKIYLTLDFSHKCANTEMNTLFAKHCPAIMPWRLVSRRVGQWLRVVCFARSRCTE